MASTWILQRLEYEEEIKLHPGEVEYTIGRGKENCIKFLSLYVSRRHCKIIHRNGTLKIIDLRSANGTYVNKTQILAEREIPLEAGDLIGFGVSEITDDSCFVFKLLYRKQNEIPAATLPGSSTSDSNFIVISDSESEDLLSENRETNVKALKRAAEQEDVINPKIPRLDGPSSDSIFSSSVNKQEKEEKMHIVQNSGFLSSGQHLESHARRVNAENDQRSGRSDRERVETVILNLGPPEAQNECDPKGNLHSDYVNDEIEPMIVCEDGGNDHNIVNDKIEAVTFREGIEQNHNIDHVSNSPSSKSLGFSGSSKSSVPEIPVKNTGSAYTMGKSKSDETMENCKKDDEKSNNSNHRIEDLAKEKNKSPDGSETLAHVLELEGRIKSLLKAEPSLKMKLLEELGKLKESVASHQNSAKVVPDENGSKETLVETSESQINLKDKSGPLERPATAPEKEKIETLKPNVSCRKDTVDTPESSTSSVRSKSKMDNEKDTSVNISEPNTSSIKSKSNNKESDTSSIKSQSKMDNKEKDTSVNISEPSTSSIKSKSNNKESDTSSVKSQSKMDNKEKDTSVNISEPSTSSVKTKSKMDNKEKGTSLSISEPSTSSVKSKSEMQKKEEDTTVDIPESEMQKKKKDAVVDVSGGEMQKKEKNTAVDVPELETGNSGVRSKSELQKKEKHTTVSNTVDKPKGSSAKIKGSKHEEQKDLSKNSKNKTDTNESSKKDSKEYGLDESKRKGPLVNNLAKKHKKEEKNDSKSKSNLGENKTVMVQKDKCMPDECSNSTDDLDSESDMRLQDVLFGGTRDLSDCEVERELQKSLNSGDEESVSKNKGHKSQKLTTLSKSCEASANEASANSSRNSSIDSNKLSVSENKRTYVTQSTKSVNRKDISDSAPEEQGKSSMSSTSKEITPKVDDNILATIKKNQLFVKLERLDSNKINSPPNDSQLDYTLDDDIIIISDDEDNMFPSSQVFDEKVPEVVIKEEILEEQNFSKEMDEEDTSMFEEEDELDADENEWLQRLSQDVIAPSSNSEPVAELPLEEACMELEEKEIAIAGDKNKGMTLKFPFGEEENEGSSLHDELLGSDIVSKESEKVHKPEKTKIHGKLLLIDAPPMPPRKANQRGISVGAATRLFNERKEQSNEVPKAKSVVKSDSTASKVKKSKKKEHRSHSSAEETNFLSATDKKHIADIRKEKLKALSVKEREAAAAAAAKANNVKVPANVRIKVTNRNRGAFLTEGAEVEEGYQTLLPTEEKTKAPIKDKSTSKSKKRDLRSSSEPVKSIKDLPRIPKLSNRLSSSDSKNAKVLDMESIVPDSYGPSTSPVLNDINAAASTVPILRDVNTVAPTNNERKKKKSVHFKEGSALTEIKIIPIEEHSRLLPVAQKKDAPPPKKVAQQPQLQKGPVLEDVLHDILSWNPKWLEEQKNKSASEPPPVTGDKVWPMLSSFTSYSDYLKVLTPLILLDLWSGVTKDSQLNLGDPRKAPVIVGIDHVDQKPYITPNQKKLMNIGCHAVLSEFESQRNHHPRVGDLVYLELELENEDVENCQQYIPSPNKRKIVPIFAYVSHFTKEAVTGTTKVHKEILPHTVRPTCKISFILQTKFRPYDVKTSHAMRIKVVSYINSELRLFKALAYLPLSPLCNHILQPQKQKFELPDIKGVKFAPSINQDSLNDSQKRAVLQTAQACMKQEPRICMIQGPPGTGKSHVIVNLIMQILYGQRSSRKHGSRRNSSRILVCAPSNAAVDELVLRLLQIRQKLSKEERFKMVRTGRQETINPQVKDISLVELAKRDVKHTAQNMETMESVELEVRNLEAQKNSKLMALESARKKNHPNVRDIEFKLGEIERKLLQMRKNKVQNISSDPRELARLERDAQQRILLGAEIVATTLSSCYNNHMENIYKQNKDSGYQFTCCIVDEATQSQELETLIPLMLGVNTLILVGDAKQLPATILSKVAKDLGLGKSLFARLQECFEETVKNPVQFLETQYRMHPEICHWPNRFFYNSRLRTATSIVRKSPLMPYCILSLDYKQDINGELSNAGEAELVSQLTLGIIEKVGSKYSIGIITPYNKQRTAILNILQSHCQGTQNVEVNTIDSFQGQERDIIVMSCVRTGGVGFLADTQRLNVALTRARYSLLLCGNFTSLRVGSDSMWRALLENAAQRKVLKCVPTEFAKNREELLKLVLCE